MDLSTPFSSPDFVNRATASPPITYPSPSVSVEAKMRLYFSWSSGEMEKEGPPVEEAGAGGGVGRGTPSKAGTGRAPPPPDIKLITYSRVTGELGLACNTPTATMATQNSSRETSGPVIKQHFQAALKSCFPSPLFFKNDTKSAWDNTPAPEEDNWYNCAK
jgi:hypothetical protein